MIESVYGIDYEVPECPDRKAVPNYLLPARQQKWTRTVIPDSFENIEFDGEDNPILTPDQEAFVEKEYARFDEGYWFYNHGQLTYITGVHYFYIQYYHLEDGDIPTYRDSDRKWFYFLDYCYSKMYIAGIIRIKKRREGASSQAACFMLLQAMLNPNSNCGIISKTEKDATDVFQKMIVPAFNKLPVFLKPRVEDPDSKTSLVLAKPKRRNKKRKKGELFTVDRGLESKIDFRSTKLNSYDSGRVTVLLIDEGGKWPKETPINKYWPIARKTLNKGIKRVGFALMISTVNDAENGGIEFKKVWDESDQSQNKVTATGLYRYFSPAYEGLEGFIDEYGHSIVEGASQETKKWLSETYGEAYDGAKEYLLKERDRKTDQEAKNEEIRMNPFTEKEAFMIDQQKCYFNVDNLSDQIEYLKKNPKLTVMRRGKFYPVGDDGKVAWADDPNGPWLVFKFPPPGQECRRHMSDYGWAPANTHKYAAGIDPHRHSHTKGNKELSKTSAWIFEKLDESDPENTGMPVAWYFDRPKLKDYMYDQILYGSIYFGCTGLYEADASDDYLSYYKKKNIGQHIGFKSYIRWTPTCAMQPLNPGRKIPGVSSKDPFAFTKQLELGQAYIEFHCHKIFFLHLLEEALLYDHEDRQVYDKMVSFLVTLINVVGDTSAQSQQQQRQVKAVVPRFNILAGTKYKN